MLSQELEVMRLHSCWQNALHGNLVSNEEMVRRAWIDSEEWDFLMRYGAAKIEVEISSYNDHILCVKTVLAASL